MKEKYIKIYTTNIKKYKQYIKIYQNIQTYINNLNKYIKISKNIYTFIKI